MPTTIDRENAKQIRRPMDVLITMQVPDDDITLSFSGYTSTSKVSDGRLTQPTWPMRRLADLQGDGFALSGSYALYESLTPSATNGKLGVRGHVGQTVNLTVTGSQQMAGLTLLVTGASAVTYNGYSHEVTSGRVSFLVGATTAALTLTPASEETRIEISEVQTGADITINNDNLISCVLSLRSDLSVENPTLPESEMNIEAYFDEDVSTAVASIPEDTPIHYQAGYDNNLSFVRNFYVAGQVTWADNVLSIHAVDAVHFLDIEVPPMFIAALYHGEPDDFVDTLRRILVNMGMISGATPSSLPYFYQGGANKEAILVPKDVTMRDILAEVSNVTRFRNIPQEYLKRNPSHNNLVVSYVDAGRPDLLLVDRDASTYNVNEEDCADIKKDIERPIREIKYKRNVITAYNGVPGLFSPYYDGVQVGTAQILKNNGVFVSLDDYVFCCFIGEESLKVYPDSNFKYEEMVPMYNRHPDGTSSYVTLPELPIGSVFDASEEWALLTGDTRNGETIDYYNGDVQPILSQVVPWNVRYPTGSSALHWTSLTHLWNYLVSRGVIDRDASYYDTKLIGYKLNIEEAEVTVSTNVNGGRSVELSGALQGRSFFYKDNEVTGEEAFPTYGLQEMLKRSNVTGSFTWKGDPRMQPRDIIHLHRLDGTVEDVTIETITLKHEGGGTTAEITYRKGVI